MTESSSSRNYIGVGFVPNYLLDVFINLECLDKGGGCVAKHQNLDLYPFVRSFFVDFCAIFLQAGASITLLPPPSSLVAWIWMKPPNYCRLLKSSHRRHSFSMQCPFRIQMPAVALKISICLWHIGFNLFTSIIFRNWVLGDGKQIQWNASIFFFIVLVFQLWLNGQL